MSETSASTTSATATSSSNGCVNLDSAMLLHRHRCLVRALLKMRVQNREQAIKWLKLRGYPVLDADVRQQWALGNRGAKDDWR